MTIMEAVRERLLSQTPLTALVAQRVYSLVLPQNERRASVKLQRIDEDAPQHLRGPAPQRTRVQTTAYVTVAGSADPLAAVEAIGAAIHGDGLGSNATGLVGFVGELGGSPAAFRIRNVRRVLMRGPFYEHDNEWVCVGLQQDYMVDWIALM